jgi:hypothetical protein
MPSSFTPLLKLELPATGELSGTWGTTVNNAITTPLSEAVAGTTTITVGGSDYTLSNGDGSAANEARKMFIVATGTPGASRNVICPAASKFYVFRNDTNQTLTLKTLSGTGIAVPAGQYRFLYCNGTDVVETFNAMASLTLGTALAAASGGTGQSSYTAGDLLYATGTTALSKLGIGAANRVLTSSGSAPQWVTSLTGLTGVSSSSITNTSLTPTRLVYSTTGGAQTDSASLAFDGSSLLVGTTTGGTNVRITSSSDGNNGLLRFFDQSGTRRLDMYAVGSAAAYVSTGGNVPLVFAINDVEQMRLNSSTLTLVANPTLSAGTANGVLYLNGSKVATSGSALTFDGTNFAVSGTGIFGAAATKLRTYSDSTYSGIFNGASLVAAESVYMGAGGLYFNASGSEQMRLTSTGLKSSIAGTNADPVFSYTSDTNTGIFFPAADKLGFVAGGGSDQMVLTSTGLGIGTSSPENQFQVGTRFGVSSGGVTRWGQVITASGRSNSGYLTWDTGLVAIGTEGATAMRFDINATERMRLDSSGNLGLGVTPSAWSLATAAQVGFGAALSCRAAGSTASDMTHAAYWNGTNWLYQSSSVGAARYEMTGANGGSTHAWYVSAGGTAGNAISFTQALTLDANRNLALNTTSVGTSAVGVLSVGSGTEPSTGPADTVQVYSVDLSAGNTIPAVYCEGSGVTGAGITNVTVTHKIAIKVNGTVYYLLATTNAT